jgi:hypothetical protein
MEFCWKTMTFLANFLPFGFFFGSMVVMQVTFVA